MQEELTNRLIAARNKQREKDATIVCEIVEHCTKTMLETADTGNSMIRICIGPVFSSLSRQQLKSIRRELKDKGVSFTLNLNHEYVQLSFKIL